MPSVARSSTHPIFKTSTVWWWLWNNKNTEAISEGIHWVAMLLHERSECVNQLCSPQQCAFACETSGCCIQARCKHTLVLCKVTMPCMYECACANPTGKADLLDNHNHVHCTGNVFHPYERACVLRGFLFAPFHNGTQASCSDMASRWHARSTCGILNYRWTCNWNCSQAHYIHSAWPQSAQPYVVRGDSSWCQWSDSQELCTALKQYPCANACGNITCSHSKPCNCNQAFCIDRVL